MNFRLATLAAALLAVMATGAQAGVVTQIGIGAFSGSETVHDFEQFVGNVDVLTTELAGSGVTFNSIPVEPHADYGPTFANIVQPFAGEKGLFQGLKRGGEEITFTSPVTRVGFHFGSNVPVVVPFRVYSGAVLTGSFDLITARNTMPFFGFEDSDGIDRIVFLPEVTSGYVSQIDNLRYEVAGPQAVPLPPAAWMGIGLLGCVGLIRRRRRRTA